MSARLSLDMIEVRNPCPADWNQMPGDARSRFCEHCQKHVYDLSAIPRDEAERLVCQSAGELCARFVKDDAGTVVTLDYRPQKRFGWGWRIWTCVALAGALITGSAEALFFGKRVPVTPPAVQRPMLGGMALPGQVSLPVSANPPTAPTDNVGQKSACPTQAR
ncbi:MAG TPA: hypothetical protein VH475_20440 [Tepidisphaeraceae bacterium]|jgi:hypothetical protein